MNKLYPIAKPETRHLFVHPAVHQEWPVFNAEYSQSEKTSYIKPGKVPNLMELCRPSNVRFSITEEPDMDKFLIKDVLFGVTDLNGQYHVLVGNELDVKLTQNGPVGLELDGYVTVPMESVGCDSESAVFGPEPFLIPVKLKYERGTRCLTLSTSGTYDNGQPELLGIILNLVHKDSKVVK